MATSDYEKRIEKLERQRDSRLSPTVILLAKYGERDRVVADYQSTLSRAALKRDQTIIVHTWFCVRPRGIAVQEHVTATMVSLSSEQPAQ